MFRSFYLAGFECATGYNMHGEWIDQIAATEHDLHCDADYSRLAEIGIHAVREAIRWPLVDQHGGYDFSTVEPFVRAAVHHGFDVVWDLFHYGYPDGLDLFSAAFPARFADYCYAAARFVSRRMHGSCYFTPINEPSYFAWAAGEVGRFAPHARGRGAELKQALARAALAGIAAIREACPAARIVNVDPICRVVPADNSPEAMTHARRFNEEWVFEFWDIVSGRVLPELGGSPEQLDIVGLNYYWTNQWQLGSEGTPLAQDDPRRVPLSALVHAAWQRYGTQIVITETSALGEERGPWIHELSHMAEELLDGGVPLQGICLYPILSMPEWHARDQWARLGLWDLEREQDVLERKACQPMLEALERAQHRRTNSQTGHRLLSLPRTGNVPFKTWGSIVWQREHHPATPYRIAIICSDRPYPLWIFCVDLQVGENVVHHLDTAAELPMLIDALRFLEPARIAELHGMDPALLTDELTSSWRTSVMSIDARQLEQHHSAAALHDDEASRERRSVAMRRSSARVKR